MSADTQELDFTPYQPRSAPSRGRSIASAAPKGFIKETGPQIRDIGRFMSQLLGIPEEESGIVPEEVAEQRVTEIFPTQDGTTERYLERFGRNLPYYLMGGPGAGAKDLAAKGIQAALPSIAGQTTEELGGGPLLQAISEIFTTGAQGAAKKGLGQFFSPQMEELSQMGQKIGMTEAELAPLLQSEGKLQTAGKLAAKRGTTSRALLDTRRGLQRVYGNLAEGGTAKKALPPAQANSIKQKMSKIFNRLPTKAQTELEKSFERFNKSPATGEDLIRLYQDVNEIYPKQSVTQRMKGPIKEGLSRLSKDLGQDFELANKFYSRFHHIAERLKPNLVDDLIKAGEAGALAYDLARGNFSGLQKILGVGAAREIGAQMITNPRFQNMTSKMVSALNKQKPALAKQFFGKIVNQIGEKNPEAAAKMRELDLSAFDDIEEGD